MWQNSALNLSFIYEIQFPLKISSFSSISFQNACSPLIEELIFFHDHTLSLLILITVLISYRILSTTLNSIINKFIIESQLLEFLWTVTPTAILILIGAPSIRLLYILDEVYSPLLTVKIVGHQWYWSYEYTDFLNIQFDSFIKPFNNSNIITRLLDVDNRLILPFNTQIRSLVTAADVLHAWTIPRLGIKTDAVPGRLNQLNFFINRPGLYFGQCSEICGANHSFIPIVIESLNLKSFISWVKQN